MVEQLAVGEQCAIYH